MPHVGLESVDGRDHAALLRQQLPQATVVGEADGEELVIAFEQIGDRAFANHQAATGEMAADLGHGSVFGVAKPADESDDVESELVMWQRDATLGFGAVRPFVGRAGCVVAAADGQFRRVTPSRV